MNRVGERVMFGRIQYSVAALLAMLTFAAQGHDRYLPTSGPVPLRFQEPARPTPPPRPLPPPSPVEQLPMPPEAPVTSATPPQSPAAPETLEPLGPPAPATPISSVSNPAPNLSTNRIDAALGSLTPEGEPISPAALIGLISRNRPLGPGRSPASAVVLAPAVFTPAQPAPVQPSSATYTVKP